LPFSPYAIFIFREQKFAIKVGYFPLLHPEMVHN